MLRRLLRQRSRETIAENLYAAAVAQARLPGFYSDLGVPDQIDARFELYTLHVLILVLRLRDEGEQGMEEGQALFDTYVSSLDNALRELGVGDMTMARKMRTLGEALYGRMTAYEGPLKSGEAGVLAQALARNIFAKENAPGSTTLADYALRARAELATQAYAVVRVKPVWPEISR